MRALIDGNSAYQAVTVMKVDWDKFSGDPIVGELGVKARATLVMFSKGEEVGRVIDPTPSSPCSRPPSRSR